MYRTNDELAGLFTEIAELIELTGEDGFRVRAYERAARALSGYGTDVADLSQRELEAIPGVGKAIAAKIREQLTTGEIAALERLRAEVPQGVRDLLAVPGLGPKRALALHRELGVNGIDDLANALASGSVAALAGMGTRTEEKLRQDLARLASSPGGIALGTAVGVAEGLVEALLALPDVQRAEAAGSLRRMKPALHDIDLLAASDDPAAVTVAFTELASAAEVLAAGDTKAAIRTRHGLQVDLRVVAPEVWGAALQYFTGSAEHNVRVRQLAVRLGLKLSEYGLFERGGDLIVAEAEDVVYERLGLEWIPPTLREDRGEVEAAGRGELPELVEVADLRGDLHVHTDLSGDGTASLEAMVEAARSRGYAYVAVTDHAEGLPINGATREQLLAQRRRVRALAAQGLPVLHGAELNIGPQGEVDYDDEFLAGFDVCVASIHSHMDQPRAQLTSRLVRACENRRVHVIGHPTGRRIGSRLAYDVDLEAVYAAAVRTGTILEMNGSPERLDLGDDEARLAASMGVRFAIDSDAHGPGHLGNVRYGVAMAQRAWLGPRHIVNTLPLDDLLALFAAKRGRA